MIDKEQQAELRAKFNPDGSDLRKMQLRMLEMLKYIDKICRENDIKYWLSSGTCLGAIRHGGFIPWDDDVDIEMCKKDYKKLIDILKKQNNDYKLQDHSQDNEYLAPYAKLRDTKSYLKESNTNDIHYKYRGIYIDIFCIEPSSSLWIFKLTSIIQYRFIYSLAKIKNNVLRKVLIFLLFPSITKIIYPFFSLLSKYNSNKWFRHIPGSGFFKRRHRQDFDIILKVPFEDTFLPVPKESDSYLKRLYGESYMCLPPLDSIKPHISKIMFFE
ncbi:MAG: LicD family protein [Muribaculaceae bacterium]|nr:LicD family protein [Muribaculaceae bacterium]